MKNSDAEFNFNMSQLEKLGELMNEAEPSTQLEKDIRNLKVMCYSIKYGSLEYRMGMVSTLRRSIKILESVGHGHRNAGNYKVSDIQ